MESLKTIFLQRITKNGFIKRGNGLIDSELDRAEKTMKEYRTIVFKIVPLLIIICSMLIVFIDKPAWRAGSISVIAMVVVILLVDGTAKDRIEIYNKKLKTIKRQSTFTHTNIPIEDEPI